MLSMTSLVRYRRLITFCFLLLFNSNSLDFCSCIITAISSCAQKRPLFHSNQLEMPAIRFFLFSKCIFASIAAHQHTYFFFLTVSSFDKLSGKFFLQMKECSSSYGSWLERGTCQPCARVQILFCIIFFHKEYVNFLIL